MTRRTRMTTTRWTAARGLVLAGVAALALGACGNGATNDPGAGSSLAWDDLSGRTFVTTDVTKGGTPYALVKGSKVRLTFTDDGVSANAGCNTMSGKAHLDGDVLVLDGPLAMTEMGCDAPLMKQDTWLAAVLADSPDLTVDADALSVVTDSYGLSMIDEETVNPDQPLVGTAWTLTGMSSGTGDDATTSTVPEGVTATMRFEEDRVAGSDGCNRFTGGYTIDGDTITFTNVATTKMACIGPADEVERTVLSVFAEPMTFTIDGDQLTLAATDQGLTYTAG